MKVSSEGSDASENRAHLKNDYAGTVSSTMKQPTNSARDENEFESGSSSRGRMQEDSASTIESPTSHQDVNRTEGESANVNFSGDNATSGKRCRFELNKDTISQVKSQEVGPTHDAVHRSNFDRTASTRTIDSECTPSILDTNQTKGEFENGGVLSPSTSSDGKRSRRKLLMSLRPGHQNANLVSSTVSFSRENGVRYLPRGFSRFGSLTASVDNSFHGSQSGADTSERSDMDDTLAGWDTPRPLHDNDTKLGHIRNRLGAFINSNLIQWIITLMITANALVLGVMTFYFDDPVTYQKLELVDLVFLSIFTGELGVQLCYFGKRSIKNLWLMFDFLIVVFSWAFLGSPVTILRSFRIFRVFSLIARWKSLRRLMAAIGRTLPNMAAIFVALAIFFYCFCVLYTNLYHNLYAEGYFVEWDYFGRLDYTFLTLFQLMTLDSWMNVVREVMQARPWAWLGLCSWVVITAFIALNLVVAVICDSLLELKSMQETKRQNKMIRQQRNLITSQTEELLRETRAMFQLQKEMIANQLEMHTAILAVADKVGALEPQENPDESLRTGKQSLATILADMSVSLDDDSDEDRSGGVPKLNQN